MEQLQLFVEVVECAVHSVPKPTDPVNNAVYINQTSGDVEYYTPGEIIEPARRVMGAIDLDPASSALANTTVRARRYFTKATDGLRQQWYGKVWMNHPFGRDDNPKWINKLCAEYAAGRVIQACCITFAATSEEWFQPLFAYPMCFLCPRTNYYLPDGSKKTGVTKGSVVTYLGANVIGFVQEFDGLGSIMLPASRVSQDMLANWDRTSEQHIGMTSCRSNPRPGRSGVVALQHQLLMDEREHEHPTG
jgi:hypothetical protein